MKNTILQFAKLKVPTKSILSLETLWLGWHGNNDNCHCLQNQFNRRSRKAEKKREKTRPTTMFGVYKPDNQTLGHRVEYELLYKKLKSDRESPKCNLTSEC